ncbi:MAG: YggS family pyridoxal phosphate-dependent enzyme [Chromatiaceae bacterium]|nr:YggS family pyridoxal phosphate-dependent enzyme [Chromatiaceae bacterium]
MSSIEQRLADVNRRIRQAEQHYQRSAGSVRLLAVSKTHPAGAIREALRAGQHSFGESYLQEALLKIGQLHAEPIEWHFIGRIQGNKTRAIAENFQWVHSLESVRHAQRLNDQRPQDLAPLNVCLQIMVDEEESKGGVTPDQAQLLIAEIARLPRLRLRGLMTLPAPVQGVENQRVPFRHLRMLREQLKSTDLPLETLSMGMTDDLEAAIAEGATIVRIGTAIFGPRQTKT